MRCTKKIQYVEVISLHALCNKWTNDICKRANQTGDNNTRTSTTTSNILNCTKVNDNNVQKKCKFLSYECNEGSQEIKKKVDSRTVKYKKATRS